MGLPKRRSCGCRGRGPLDRRPVHLESALDAIDAGRQLGQNLAKRFQVAVRRVHEGSRALSAKRMRLARYFCRETAGHGEAQSRITDD